MRGGGVTLVAATEPLTEPRRLRVKLEVVEPVGDVMVGQKLEEEFVELEGERKLAQKLVGRVEELEEERRCRRGLAATARTLPDTLVESVPEHQPLLLDKRPETSNRPVDGIHHHLRKRDNLQNERRLGYFLLHAQSTWPRENKNIMSTTV